MTSLAPFFSNVWVKVEDEAVFRGHLSAGTCTSKRSKYTTQLEEERGGNLQRERGFTDCAFSVHTFTLILCVSDAAAVFVWCAYTYTITHPKPQPAKIQFESPVWHVQLRCTNAAYSCLEKWDTLCFLSVLPANHAFFSHFISSNF